MPVMDGQEVCERLRSDSRFDGLYTIMMSVRADTADKVRALDSGADEYITKPFQHDELLARLRSAQRIQSLNRDLTRALEQLRADIIAAASVQRNLLPRGPLEYSPLSFAWDFIPAEDIAGDMFDVFRIDEDHIGFYMFDVSGHGVAPAMLSASLHHTISPGPLDSTITKIALPQAPFYRLAEPPEVMDRLNQHFQMSRTGLYFTMFYGLINVRTLHMRYCRSGQAVPSVMRGAETFDLAAGDVPVGLFPEAKFRGFDFQFQPGDRLLLFSDGVIEAMNGRGEEFGPEQVKRVVLECGGRNLSATIAKLIADVRSWQGRSLFDDDLSILMMEVQANAQ